MAGAKISGQLLEFGEARALVGNISALARQCPHRRTRTLMRVQAWQIARANDELKAEKKGKWRLKNQEGISFPKSWGNYLIEDAGPEGQSDLEEGMVVEGVRPVSRGAGENESRILNGISNEELIHALKLIKFSKSVASDHLETVGSTAQAAKRDRTKPLTPADADDRKDKK